MGRLIGAGGFGLVFEAEHLALGSPVAVKVFRPRTAGDEWDRARALARFRREARIASRLRHPNTVCVLDAGMSSDGTAYLVTELLVGRTLAEELHAVGRLSVDWCSVHVPPLCRALAAVHAAGVVHRDVKPENVFLHEERGGIVVKLLDFGIAELEGDAGDEASDDLLGTLTYMAPERVLGMGSDASADVFSLSMLVYEMLSGRLPFPAPRGLAQATSSIRGDEPTALRELVPGVSGDVASAVMRGLRRDAVRRPGPLELAEALAAARPERPAVRAVG
jgi:serine/threonine protein kinase